MIKLPDVAPLSLQRVQEIANGSNPLMGEVVRLATTALGYFEDNKSTVEAFQHTGFTLLERERQLEVALAEIQRLNATAQPVKLPTTRLWAGKVDCYSKEDVISMLKSLGLEVSE